MKRLHTWRLPVFMWYYFGKITAPIIDKIYRITPESKFRITAAGNRRVTAGSP